MSLTAAQTTALNKLKNTPLYTATTWNGDQAYSSSGDPRMDLFFKGFVRGCNDDNLNNMLNISWCKYPEDTVKLIIHSRDCRSGKGEKKVSYQGMLWLRKFKPLTYIMNLATFLEHGYFKDLLHLAGFASDFNLSPLGEHNYLELELLAEYLKEDIEKVTLNDNSHISLAAKWAPSEGKHFDIKYGFAEDMAILLFGNNVNPKKEYRLALSKLRKQLNVVETLITQNRWNEVEFQKVPAKAHRLLRKAFLRHAPQEYEEYISNLKLGKLKINVTGTHPHELVSTYFKTTMIDETIEGQWKALVNDVKDKGLLSNTIAVSDVSGSMMQPNGIPMSVSIALGILIAQCCDGAFNNKLISFSENPQVHELRGETLSEMVKFTKNMDWGMSTNLDRVFNLLLNIAKLTKLSPENMIKNIVIISDMQFNTAVHSSHLSAFDRNRKMFKDAGYELPKIVFWNVNGEITSVPVKADETGAFLISGFSAELLKDLISNGFDTDPVGFLMNILSKYNVVVDESEI